MELSLISLLKESLKNPEELQVKVEVEVKVMLRRTVSQQVRLGVKHASGKVTRVVLLQTIAGLLLWGALYFSYVFWFRRDSGNLISEACPKHQRVKTDWPMLR
jgi:hypothetical protein